MAGEGQKGKASDAIKKRRRSQEIVSCFAARRKSGYPGPGWLVIVVCVAEKANVPTTAPGRRSGNPLAPAQLQ